MKLHLLRQRHGGRVATFATAERICGIACIAQLVNEFAFHDLGHIRQVVELYRSHVFYPEMGAYRGYYKISP